MDVGQNGNDCDHEEVVIGQSADQVLAQFSDHNAVADQPSTSQTPKSGGSRHSFVYHRSVEPRAYPGPYDVQKEMAVFWPQVKKKIETLDNVGYFLKATLRDANRHQELPLARIKKIMKLDDDVKNQMISAEAPVLLAKAAEIFIEELTLRSWVHTEESKRKTLQKSDISQAVSRYEQFDFLIDIVPRDDTRRSNQAGSNIGSVGCLEGEVVDDKLYTVATPGPSSAPMQFILQVPSNEGSLPSGSMLQATPIGQPIQLPASNGSQPIQLIALGLPDGNVQQFQVQLPPTS